MEIYSTIIYPLVDHLFKHNNARSSVFAYGQTGAGKTYTMMSERDGMYLLACRDIFSRTTSVVVSFYEIYQNSLYDLLNDRRRLNAREYEGEVRIVGLEEREVSSIDELLLLLQVGSQSRSTGTTLANDESSRSHAILTITVDKSSRISFIDLAGSERGVDRGGGGGGGGSDNKTRIEGSEINKSLLALKECIRSLSASASSNAHTPFRQSKLTMVLRDSFKGSGGGSSGRSMTCMIACVSPDVKDTENTLNTLRYADRVKELRSKGGSNDNIATTTANSTSNDDLIINETIPTTTTTTTTTITPTTTKKKDILTNLNSQMSQSRISISDNSSNNTSTLVKLHKQHLLRVTEMSRREMEVIATTSGSGGYDVDVVKRLIEEKYIEVKRFMDEVNKY
jgi:hypothetical protein